MFQGQPEILAELIFSVCSLAFWFSLYEIHPHFLVADVAQTVFHSLTILSFIQILSFLFSAILCSTNHSGSRGQAIQTGNLSRANYFFRGRLFQNLPAFTHSPELSVVVFCVFFGLCIGFIFGFDSEFIAVTGGRIISLRISMTVEEA